MESIYNMRRVFLNWMILSMKLLTCGICCWHFYPPWKSSSTIKVVFSNIVTYKMLVILCPQLNSPSLAASAGKCPGYTDKARPKNHQEDPGPEFLLILRPRWCCDVTTSVRPSSPVSQSRLIFPVSLHPPNIRPRKGRKCSEEKYFWFHRFHIDEFIISIHWG